MKQLLNFVEVGCNQNTAEERGILLNSFIHLYRLSNLEADSVVGNM